MIHFLFKSSNKTIPYFFLILLFIIYIYFSGFIYSGSDSWYYYSLAKGFQEYGSLYDIELTKLPAKTPQVGIALIYYTILNITERKEIIVLTISLINFICLISTIYPIEKIFFQLSKNNHDIKFTNITIFSYSSYIFIMLYIGVTGIFTSISLWIVYFLFKNLKNREFKNLIILILLVFLGYFFRLQTFLYIASYTLISFLSLINKDIRINVFLKELFAYNLLPLILFYLVLINLTPIDNISNFSGKGSLIELQIFNLSRDLLIQINNNFIFMLNIIPSSIFNFNYFYINKLLSIFLLISTIFLLIYIIIFSSINKELKIIITIIFANIFFCLSFFETKDINNLYFIHLFPLIVVIINIIFSKITKILFLIILLMSIVNLVEFYKKNKNYNFFYVFEKINNNSFIDKNLFSDSRGTLFWFSQNSKEYNCEITHSPKYFYTTRKSEYENKINNKCNIDYKLVPYEEVVNRKIYILKRNK